MAMRVESTQEESTWHSASAIRLPLQCLRRSARRNNALQHNNGMHPTANSVALISRDLSLAELNARRVMPGVMSPLRVDTQLIPAAPLLNDAKLVWIVEWPVE